MGVPMNNENAVQNLQNGESNEDIKASLRPWSRYFAKSIDSVILFFIAGALFLGGEWLVGSDSLFMFVLFILAAVVFFALEAIQISKFGTTVGKFMFGITVFKQNGQLLSFDESLKRAFLSWLRSGLGLPLVSLIMYIYQYNQLMKNNVTSWDKELKVLVKCPEVQAWKWLVIVPIWFVLLVAQSIAIKVYDNVDNQSLSTTQSPRVGVVQSNANQPVAVNTNPTIAQPQITQPAMPTLLDPYNQAKANNAVATDSINKTWYELPKQLRAAWLVEQRKWVVEKTTKCGGTVDPARDVTLMGDVAIQTEINLLNCEAAENTLRNAVLQKAYATYVSQPSTTAITYTDDSGEIYVYSRNNNGFVLNSNNTALFLGKSCDAYSPQYGNGNWGWTNGGIFIHLPSKNIIFGQHQELLENDGRCAI